jgi:hypothetical protein
VILPPHASKKLNGHYLTKKMIQRYPAERGVDYLRENEYIRNALTHE